MTAFYVKKILGALIQPLPILAVLLLLTTYFLFRKRYRQALYLNLVTVAAFFIFSTPFLNNLVLPTFERKFHQFDITQSVDYVVVLGCGHRVDGSIPITAQVHHCSLSRTAEGIRIVNANPHARLITSGFGGNEPITNAEMNRDLAIALGVPEHRIIIEGRPKDTQEEAKYLLPILTGKRFALVTSASHMPRAMKFFESNQLEPIAAPTDYLAKDDSRAHFWQQFPTSDNVHKSERIIYETLGQIWQFLIS